MIKVNAYNGWLDEDVNLLFDIDSYDGQFSIAEIHDYSGITTVATVNSMAEAKELISSFVEDYRGLEIVSFEV